MEVHVARIADALAAQNTLADQAARDAVAQRAEQRACEEFAYQLTKAKTVLNPPFLVAMMLYPPTIALSLQARSNKFSLLIPTTSVPGTPVDQMGLMGPHNQWRINDDPSVLMTISSFLTVMALHTYILLHLRLTGPPAGAKMVTTLAWLPAIMSFWGSTNTYFMAYMSMNRYGVGRFDMIFTAVCSGILFLMTLFFIAKPVPHAKVVKAAQAPPAQH